MLFFDLLGWGGVGWLENEKTTHHDIKALPVKAEVVPFAHVGFLGRVGRIERSSRINTNSLTSERP